MGDDGAPGPRRFGRALIAAELEKRAHQGRRVLQRLARWGRKSSLWLLPFGTSCCGGESLRALVERSDFHGTGVEVAAAPQQADLLVVSGRVTLKSLPVLLETYGAMPEPKWVLSLGDASSDCGPPESYAHAGAVNDFLPIDVYVPGCPPTPESLQEGLRQIQELIDAPEPS